MLNDNPEYKNVKPVKFAGCEYRSTTEARWAVFFSKMEIFSSYEKESFQMPDSKPFYTPDFYLHNIGAYLEIKPIDEKFLNSEVFLKLMCLKYWVGQLDVFLIQGSPYDNFRCSKVVGERIKEDVLCFDLESFDLYEELPGTLKKYKNSLEFARHYKF